MRPFMLPALAAMAFGLLAGCTTLTPSTDVTRFHRLGTTMLTPAAFTIAAPAPMLDERAAVAPRLTSLEQATYEAAVSREMQRLGFALHASTDNAPAPYIVRVVVDRTPRTTTTRRSPVSVGVGGGTGSYGSGVGVGVGINLGGGGSGDQVVTRLSVRIDRSGDPLALWEGRAEYAAGVRTPAAQPGIAADKLARALFEGFPGRSGETITVE